MHIAHNMPQQITLPLPNYSKGIYVYGLKITRYMFAGLDQQTDSPSYIGITVVSSKQSAKLIKLEYLTSIWLPRFYMLDIKNNVSFSHSSSSQIMN